LLLFDGDELEMAFNRNNSVSSARPRPQALFEGADAAEDPDCSAPLADATTQPALARSVYCVLGIPIDAVNLATVVQRVETAAATRTVFLISTPNLNFLVSSLSDPEFRESLLDSDLCPPDGAPIVWIARLLGLPIKERVAGSDLFDQLRAGGTGIRRLAIFLFGGAKGVAATAAGRLNAEQGGLNCVGTMDPGFCEVSEMSQDHVMDTINASGADFLVLSLGAKKGQLWLQRNHHRLTIPVRSHLGAAVNFQAGLVKRAPPIVRAWDLEWLWRIKEEHYLWKRYRDDGFVLLRLLLTRVLPLAVITRWQQFSWKHRLQDLLIKKSHNGQSIVISLCGVASEQHVPKATSCFQEALASKQDIIMDLTNTRLIDARFLGLLLMLRKELKSREAKLTINGASRPIERIFRFNELGFLLST
jgi:N-acetylglucosaminyldiphosphoundecaprenol N-acetyl-beta-D-mannosaminyltransferase